MVLLAGSVVLFMLSGMMAAPLNQTSSSFLKEFQEKSCSIIKAVKVPSFDSTPSDGDDVLKKLMKPLDICKDSSLEDYSPLCAEVYEMLIHISTCQIHMENTEHSDEFETINVSARDDVCSGFKEVGETFLVNDNVFSPFLKNQRLCKMTCQGKYESVCRVLLWVHEVQVKLFELPDVNKLDRFLDAFKYGNCSFPNVEIPVEFRNIEKSNDLMENLKIPLKYCNDIIVYQKKQIIICYEIFRVLSSLSSCSPEIQKNENLKVQKDIQPNVCEGFRNFKKNLPTDGKVVIYLDNNLVCDSLCSGDAEAVCQVLLWAHEIKQSLLVKPIDEKIPEGTVQSSFVSSTLDSLDSNKNINPDKNAGLESVNAEEKLPEGASKNSVTFNNKIQSADETPASNYTNENNDEEIDNTKKAQVSEAPSDSENTWSLAISPNSSIEETNKDASGAEKSLVNTQIPDENNKDKLTDSSYNEEDKPGTEKESIPSVGKSSLVQDTTTAMSDSLASPTVQDIDDIYSSSNAGNSQTPKDSSDSVGPIPDDASFGMTDQKTAEQSYMQSKESIQEGIIEQGSPNFFLYFLCIVALVTGCYIVIHNKQKVIALIVEGRHERRRRPHTTSYKKLNE